MATNEFLPFGTGAGSNVLSQALYEALAARSTGYQSGIAKSIQVNKTLRQAAFVAAMIGQFTADYGGDALDNGDLPTFEDHFKAALAAWIASGSNPIDLSSYVLRAGDTMTGLFTSPVGFKTAARLLNTSTALNNNDSGKIVNLSSGTVFTTTFPSPISNGGATFTLYNSSGISQTLATPDGAFVGPGASGLTSDSIPAGSSREYMSDGYNWALCSAAYNTAMTAALPKLSLITTSSTFTPQTATKALFVLAHGPGGAGAGTNGGVAGSGGSAGGWALSRLSRSDIGGSVSCIIGAGGTGVTGAKGGNGAGNTSFGALVVAGPGEGGYPNFSSYSTPGIGLFGQILGRGNPGFPAPQGTTSVTGDFGGMGGAGLLAGAGLGWSGDFGPTSTPSPTIPGTFGSGGGGRDRDDTGANAGGDGGDGFILVVEV